MVQSSLTPTIMLTTEHALTKQSNRRVLLRSPRGLFPRYVNRDLAMNIFHAFIFEGDAATSEQEIFEKVEAWFAGSPGNVLSLDSNPFTNKNILKITTDGKYVTSFQYEKGKIVADDYSEVSDSEVLPSARVRVLMGPDENNEFDDMAVMVLQLLAEFTKTPIYNVTAKQFIT